MYTQEIKSIETEFASFEGIHSTLNKNPSANQREVAASLNLSLGTTNALLRRFCEKGWLCVKKLNSKTIHYLVTPEGLNVLAHRSYNYLRRTWKMMNLYQDSINNFIAEYKLKGIERVIIQSELDIAFLFESACDKNEINYVKYTISEIIERNSTNKKSLIIVEDEKDASSIKNLINKSSACCSIIEIMGILG